MLFVVGCDPTIVWDRGTTETGGDSITVTKTWCGNASSAVFDYNISEGTVIPFTNSTGSYINYSEENCPLSNQTSDCAFNVTTNYTGNWNLSMFVNQSWSDFNITCQVEQTNYTINSTSQVVAQPLTNGTWCYQETANVSTSCGGLATGSYGFSPDANWYDNSGEYNYLMWDGEWETSAQAAAWLETTFANFTINVTLPSRVTNESLWVTKTIGGWPTYTHNHSNYSISDCWTQAVSDGKLILKITSDNSAEGVEAVRGYCWNGTQEIMLFNHTYPDDYPGIVEEGMWWHIEGITTKCWVDRINQSSDHSFTINVSGVEQ